jgi:hypothetical protein
MYVIGSSEDGPCKLGISVNPDRRLTQLQTGHAARLHLYHQEPVPAPKARLYEQLLHRDVGYERAVGEWFNLTVEEAIAQIQFTLIHYGETQLRPS